MPKVPNGPEQRRFWRAAQRITCEVLIDGRWTSGIVQDVSARGVFVQISVAASPGTPTCVRMRSPDGAPIELAATVVRSKRPHRDLRSVERAGLGLEIASADEAYFQLLMGLEPSS